MRRCLDCPALIASGSRCKACQARYRSSYSRHQWAQEVKARAGNRCEQCGSYDRVQADHVTPLSMGGRDTFENGRALCHSCHQRVHGQSAAKAG
ncbi:MAG: HNH endonuclease [Thermomicrobiales bacterium]